MHAPNVRNLPTMALLMMFLELHILGPESMLVKNRSLIDVLTTIFCSGQKAKVVQVQQKKIKKVFCRCTHLSREQDPTALPESDRLNK